MKGGLGVIPVTSAKAYVLETLDLTILGAMPRSSNRIVVTCVRLCHVRSLSFPKRWIFCPTRLTAKMRAKQGVKFQSDGESSYY